MSWMNLHPKCQLYFRSNLKNIFTSTCSDQVSVVYRLAFRCDVHCALLMARFTISRTHFCLTATRPIAASSLVTTPVSHFCLTATILHPPFDYIINSS